MRVRFKQTGQTGTIPDDKFDPAVFESLDVPSAPSVAQAAPAPQPESNAPVSDVLGNSGLLGKLLSLVTRPGEKAIRSIGGGGIALGASIPALLGNKNAQDFVLNQDIPGLTKEQEAVLRGNDTGKVMQEGIRAGANAANYIPGGKGASAFSTGAIRGLSGAIGNSEGDLTSPENLASDLIGATTGGLTEGVVSNALPFLKNLGKGRTNKVSEKFAANLFKSSPGAIGNATDAGINPLKIPGKYNLVGNNYDDFIGAVDERGYGGQIGQQMQEAEAIIQNTVKSAKPTEISLTPVIDDLTKLKQSLSKLPTNKDKVAQLDEIIIGLRSQYKGGKLSAENTLEIVRSANEQFGKSVVQEEKGAINTQINKVIANNLRKQLKGSYEPIKQALEKEQELIIAREMLKDARDKSLAGGLKLGKFNITQPGSIIDPALQNPAVASRMAQGGGIPIAEATGPSVAGPLASILFNQPQVANAEQPVVEDQISQDQMAAPDEVESGNTITPEMLQQARLVLSEKEFSKLKDIYDIQNTVPKEPSQAQQSKERVRALVQDAYKQFKGNKDLKVGVLAGPTQGLMAKLGMADPATLEFLVTIGNLKALIAKERGGTSFTPNEEKLLNAYTPNEGDSVQELATKLEKLYQQFGK